MIYLLCTNFRGYNSAHGRFLLSASSQTGDWRRGIWTSKTCGELKIDIFVLHSLALRVTHNKTKKCKLYK